VEMNWSTFILEIINFLILVWILKRFLYKPVLEIIERRRENIDQTLEDSKAMQINAKKLQEQYENRLQDWANEKQQAYNELAREIKTEREKRLQELKISLEQKKQQLEMSEQKRIQATITRAEHTALRHGAQFASRLLSATAGPETQSRLLELLIDELKHLSPEQLKKLRNSGQQPPEQILISSAYPLSKSQSQMLEKSLGEIMQLPLSLHYEQDESLLAGLQIVIGDWVLAINVRDELKGFVDLAYEN